MIGPNGDEMHGGTVKVLPLGCCFLLPEGRRGVVDEARRLPVSNFFSLGYPPCGILTHRTFLWVFEPSVLIKHGGYSEHVGVAAINAF